MPSAKKVRFSNDIAVHPLYAPSSPAPPVYVSSYPSPYGQSYAPYSPYSSSSSSSSSSQPTLSDSDGPITPPSLNHKTSPYSSAPLPAINVTLNPHLCLPTIRGGGPAPASIGSMPLLSLDLTQDAPVARLPISVLSEPATYPPLPYVSVVHKKLPWEIRVVPTDPKRGYVTVRDVLCGIPEDLRQPASGAEYELIPSDRARKEVSDAYARRCSALSKTAVFEPGLKRVDFLEGRNKFSGLTPTKKGPEVWELHTTA